MEKQIEKFKCEKCNFKCKFESMWLKHCETELHKTGTRKKRSDSKGIQKCEKCDYKTENQTTMKQHILNEHSTKEEREKGFKYYCKYCNYGTFSKDLHNRHVNTEKHKNFAILYEK